MEGLSKVAKADVSMTGRDVDMLADQSCKNFMSENILHVAHRLGNGPIAQGIKREKKKLPEVSLKQHRLCSD
jgi:hypothetical protein